MECNDDNRPILVQFENGPLKEEHRSSVDFQYLRSTGARGNKRRMLVANCDGSLYSGTVIQKQSNLVKYYIGVVDKETHCLENVDAVQLCTLKPKFQDTGRGDDAKEKKSYREETDTLVEAFGSAKQKRLVASRKKNSGVMETVGDKVGDVAKKMIMEFPKTPSANEEHEFEDIVPQMNKDAPIPSQIYNIKDIISDNDYAFLLEHSKELTTCDEATLRSWRDAQKYPEFIFHQISKLSERRQSIRPEKACQVSYLNHLIAFTKVGFRDFKKQNPCPSIPEELITNIFDKFTHADDSGRNRCLPKKSKDKLYCYIFILALFLEDFDMDCNLLLRDLKLGVARVTKLLRAIGCSVKTINIKRQSGEGLSERVIRATLETVRSKKKDEEIKAATPVAPGTKALTASQIQEDINMALVKKEEPEFRLDQWK